MNLKPNLFYLAAIALAAAPTAKSQDDAGEGALAIANQQAEAYAEAYRKGDAKALVALFTADAQYGSDAGELISGRDQIGERAAAYFSANPDVDLTISVEDARFLTQDVLVEKGYAELSNGETRALTRYSATHVRKDDRWLIGELQETALPPAEPGAEAMLELEWLVGKWAIKDGSIKAEMDANWILDGRFISRVTRIYRESGEVFTIVDMIGYDPVRGQIRSWLFDNEGGFGEGAWRREANKWLVRTKATSPGGGLSSAEHIFTVLDADRMSLESINRVLDGEALPNIDRLEIERVPAETSDSSDQ